MKPIEQMDESEFATLVAQAVRSPGAPPFVLRAAIGQWRPVPTLGDVAADVLRHVRAWLTFDSWSTTPMALGMRSGQAGGRHLLFSSEGRDIDLRIAPADSHFSVSGQILGPDERGEVDLVPAGEAATSDRRLTAPLGELGEFRLDGVREGTYRVTLRFADAVVELPDVLVGERTA